VTRPRHVHTSVVKKSAAAIAPQCAFKNVCPAANRSMPEIATHAGNLNRRSGYHVFSRHSDSILVAGAALSADVDAPTERDVVLPLSLIWNDPLSSPRSCDGGLADACKRQLAGTRASDHVAGAVSRGAAGAARRARSPGGRVRHVVSRMPLSTRAAKTTDARGRFDDESR
jgi:hypothetical protein